MSNGIEFDLELAVKGFDSSLKKADKNVQSFHKDFKSNVKKSYWTS